MSENELEVPKQPKGGVAHSVAKASLSAIPLIGRAAIKLFQNVVQPPLEKQRAEWEECCCKYFNRSGMNGCSLSQTAISAQVSLLVA